MNLPSSILRNEYNTIIQNILKSYIEQSSLKAQLKENRYKMEILQLTALQSQMNPHFLFNTLKAIFWMSFKLTNSKNEVSQMVENLSNILYYSMDHHTNYVSFRKEIENTQDYIEIEKMRYKDQLDVIWEYPEDIDRYYTLKLLIQPFVENSIHHGLRVKEDKRYIKIKIIDRHDHLMLYVTDNGVGIDQKELMKLNRELKLKRENMEHIGIYNCNRRLFLAFGEQYGITIKSNRGFGTSVSICLPKIEENDLRLNNDSKINI
jgi:two-component system sensor histidine kinase YesM